MPAGLLDCARGPAPTLSGWPGLGEQSWVGLQPGASKAPGGESLARPTLVQTLTLQKTPMVLKPLPGHARPLPTQEGVSSTGFTGLPVPSTPPSHHPPTPPSVLYSPPRTEKRGRGEGERQEPARAQGPCLGRRKHLTRPQAFQGNQGLDQTILREGKARLWRLTWLVWVACRGHLGLCKRVTQGGHPAGLRQGKGPAWAMGNALVSPGAVLAQVAAHLDPREDVCPVSWRLQTWSTGGPSL
ncbi:hypothetical protein H8959_008402 [Pygathrix nigripes]